MTIKMCIFLVGASIFLTVINFIMVFGPKNQTKPCECENATLRFQKVGIWMHDVDLNCPEGAVIRTYQDSKGNFVIYSIEGLCY